MKIAIADDQAADRQKLSAILRQQFSAAGYQLVTIEEFSCGEALLAALEQDSFDLIFLDIYMQALNGIETARLLRQRDQEVRLVFITSSNEFASESYAVRASDYLLKPYTEADVAAMICRLDLSQAESRQLVTFPDGQSVALGAILYTSYAGHYAAIHKTDGTTFQVRITQSACADLLLAHPGFVSCNKGMLVNLRQVQRLEEDRFVMNHDIVIPISRRRYAEVKKTFLAFLIRLTS